MADAWHILSDVPGVAWPALPPAGGASVLALLHQMEESQWLAPAELAARQSEQIDALLEHAFETVPFYRERWKRRPRHGDLGSLPVLTRRDVQSNFQALASTRVPASHGSVFEVATSGSSGAPLRVLQTGLSALYWNAFTLRDHAWHGRELSCKLAVVKTRTQTARAGNWGVATYGLVDTGPALMFDEEHERDEQLRWLEQEAPDILLTHASNALALARRSLALGMALRLREVRTYGDALDPEAHDVCARAWGARVTDTYSASELGYVALQCPQHRHYHVQSEGMVLEVLDEAGRACAPGEAGRAVVSVLHNFAMPLIRYAVGDVVTMGAPCQCGRGLPVLTRILGRTRNLLRTRDGRVYWPYLGSMDLATLAPVRSHQFVQKSFDLVQALLVVDEPLTPEQEGAVRALFAGHLPAGIRLEIAYVESFPGSAGGKYEYFVSELPQE